MAEKQDNQQPTDPNAEPAEPKAPKGKAKEPTVTLTFIGAPYSGTLSVGHENFPVENGTVEVPTRLAEVAGHAGFR